MRCFPPDLAVGLLNELDLFELVHPQLLGLHANNPEMYDLLCSNIGVLRSYKVGTENLAITPVGFYLEIVLCYTVIPVIVLNSHSNKEKRCLEYCIQHLEICVFFIYNYI